MVTTWKQHGIAGREKVVRTAIEVILPADPGRRRTTQCHLHQQLFASPLPFSTPSFSVLLIPPLLQLWYTSNSPIFKSPISPWAKVTLSRYPSTPVLTSLPCLASQDLSSHPPSFPCFSLTLPTAWHPAPQILKLQLSLPPHPTSLTLLLSSWTYFQADFCLPLCNNTSSTTPQ